MCRCHLGKSIVYDTVMNLSWSVHIGTHGIVNVIDNILSKPWKASVDSGREVPLAKPDKDCVVRFPLSHIDRTLMWSTVGVL